MCKQPSRRRVLQLITGAIAAFSGCNSVRDDSNQPADTEVRETTTTAASSAPSLTTSRTTTRQRTTIPQTTVEQTLVSMKPPRFSLTFEQKEIASDFLKLSKLTLRGGTGHKVETYDIGTNESGISFVQGASEPRRSNGRTWRSLDSPTTIELTDANRLDTFSAFDMECRPRAADTPLHVTAHGLHQNSETVTSDEWQTLHFSLLYE